METLNIFNRTVKWRFQNPVTIVMNLVQPLIWLVLFSTLFANSNAGTGDYTAFVLPGIFVMAILTGAGISGIANYSLKKNGSFYRIAISPTKRGAIILGHVLDVCVLVFIQLSVLSIIAFIMGVRVATGLPGILLALPLLFLVVLFVASVSYAVSMAIPDENAFIAMANTFNLPLFFLSTALTPKEAAPAFFRVLITINPFTYAVDSLRNIISGPALDWQLLGLTAGIFVVLGGLAFVVAKKSCAVKE